MGKSVLLLLSHSIEEHDQVKLLSSLGYDVFSLGGYIDPAHPHDPKRPPVPEAPAHPELQAAVDALGVEDNIGAAASRIPDTILDWLGDDGIIIAHLYLEARIYPQWDRLGRWLAGSSGRRIIRRTVGQSVSHNERIAAEFVARGMETVRYSPKERNIPGYSGEDALIRFWAHPDGIGELAYDAMRDLLRRMRVYVYTGTQPASYTLGLLEAMMTGTPVVSIGPSWMNIEFSNDGASIHDASAMFEGHALATAWSDDPDEAREMIGAFLDDDAMAHAASDAIRAKARALFDPAVVGAQWAEFLG